MEWAEIARALGSLLLVAGLIFLCGALLKKYGNGLNLAPKNGTRLAVSETLHIDAKRKLVLIKRDNREHLLLLGVNSDLLVESGIEARANSHET